MKLIKKIAAIMFAFMMIVSMSCNVKAEEGSYNDGNGSITITNAHPGQTYTIYRMLKLDSFSGENYSYLPETGWDAFITNPNTGGKYLKKDKNGYVDFIADRNDLTVLRKFAQEALTFAKGNGSVTAEKPVTATGNTVTFGSLALGYYLVDSTAGTLCGLDTTNKDMTINDKNELPTVEKKILENNVEKSENSAFLGESLTFQTTIHMQPGAQNYILHDKMDTNLQYIDNSILMHASNNQNPTISDYTIKTSKLGDDCTFHIEFKADYLAKVTDKFDVIVTYGAVVKDGAPINTALVNDTWLTYGENNTESNKPQTKTYTFGIPVFKYTGTNKPLAGAEFKLYTDSNCNDESTALKFSLNNNNKYRYDSTKGKTVLTSLETTGHIDIEGLKEGTYYLKETKAPKGYNLLKAPVEIRIDSAGKIYVDGSTKENTGNVEVKNNSGTLLPSTGGAGTTMIYLVGALLVLGSGVVLASKRRSNSK